MTGIRWSPDVQAAGRCDSDRPEAEIQLSRIAAHSGRSPTPATCGHQSASRALPELTRLHDVDSPEGTERKEILIHGDQDVGVPGNRRSKNRNILWVPANTRVDFGRLYEPRGILQET